MGETTPFAEFPELNSQAVLERFLCHVGAKYAGKETLYLSFLHLKYVGLPFKGFPKRTRSERMKSMTTGMVDVSLT